ncbi:MAG TPA: SMP-30/gluconolactonase/LRE family protein [Propionicimonas sp.]|uniref:SMP-30/gluconolactonase/LRE family protein n=1 Tax=Propionicimonas sp. TaxID=1955623 RepID=UPI002F404F7E
MRAERVTGPVSYHGEGPVWWERWQQLRFVDMFAGDVLTLDGDQVTRVNVGSPIAAVVRPRMGGGAIVARERDLAISNFDDLSDLAGFVTLTADEQMRSNDGCCDPDGGFWIGTLEYGFRAGAGTLYQLDAGSLRARPVVSELSISNGIGWSPDSSVMYLNDSGTGITWAFDYDPVEGLTHRRVFAEPADDGLPDGLCVDVEGGVWTARWGAGRVQRYDASGTLDAVVELPPSQVSACCFGGPNLDRLYITTSRENLPADAEPEAGSLYSFKPGVTGLPVACFAG